MTDQSSSETERPAFATDEELTGYVIDGGQPEPPFDENHYRYHTPAGPNPDCPNCKWLNWHQGGML